MGNVIILHDRLSPQARDDERDVLDQLMLVRSALEHLGHTAVPAAVSLDLTHLKDTLRDVRPVLVVNLVESLEGRGRWIHLVPSLLDGLGIPYTGAPAEAVFLTSNKLLTKKLLRSGDIPTPEWMGPDRRWDNGDWVPGRYLVKSVWEHASVGLDDHSLIDAATPSELGAEMDRRATAVQGEVFAERYIEGREFNISLLDNGDDPQVLPHAEIRFVDYPDGKARIVGYRAKWAEDSFEYTHTCRSFEFAPDDAGLLARLSEISRRCWRQFDLRGYARVDFRVDAEGRPWVLEINANPCLSPDAGFIAAAGRAGLGTVDVVERILRAIPVSKPANSMQSIVQ